MQGDRMKNFDNDKKNNDKDREGLQLIIGRNPVTEALKSGRLIDTVFVDPDAKGSIANIIRLAKQNGIVVKQARSEKLDRMSGGASHQGVAAMVACAEYSTVEKMLEDAAAKGEDPFLIICDEIEDPHNLGAIIRTAETAGAHGVIIPERRSASLNATVYKTSAGAVSWMPVARVKNLAACIDDLKKQGVWIYGTDGSGEDYRSVSMKGAMALVIGSEGFGMGRLIKDKCDFLLSLPMKGRINSLNASVAAGIFMYEAVRQRQEQG